jgi:predicted NAD/FAD-binding protein
VLGGGREYVKRCSTGVSEVRLGEPVSRVLRAVRCDRALADRRTRFDHVILASHSDQSLALLAMPTTTNAFVLGRVRYQDNDAWLHTDHRLLPRKRDAWSAWNYVTGRDRRCGRSSRVGQLPPQPPAAAAVRDTRDRHAEPRARAAAETVIRRITYAHPIFDAPAIAAQQALPGIQGRRRTWFCGAWTGYGFHEDGLRSAGRRSRRGQQYVRRTPPVPPGARRRPTNPRR